LKSSRYNNKKNLLKKLLRRLFKKIAKRLDIVYPRSYTGNPYATHLPVLISLAQMYPIKRAIEFGMGFYSTNFFLNNKVFPDLVEFRSYEDNFIWFERMQRQIVDRRWDSRFVEVPLYEKVCEIDFQGVDIVLIDNATETEERCKTISEVLKYCDPFTIVVVHDFEQASYQNATMSWPHRYRFQSLFPNTGVIWNQRKLSKIKLFCLDQALLRNLKIIETWLGELDKTLEE